MPSGVGCVRDNGVSVVNVHDLPDWFSKQTEDLLFNYRADIRRHLDRIEDALQNTSDSAEQLLEEVVIDGELTVPGAASKLVSRMKSATAEVPIPDTITYSSVEKLLADLEAYLREATDAGRRYIPRLPKVHKRIIKELDYQFRTIGQGYQKIKKIWEKDKLPKQLDLIRQEVEEIDQRAKQVVKLSEQLAELHAQKAKMAGKIAEQHDDIEQFRKASGLTEIDGIRREIDSIRMIVTNQLNFLKKPFKKLSQAAGRIVMISSTAGEGAETYSNDPWQAFQDDTETLEKLKTALTALADAIETGKIKFKTSLNRKATDRREEICNKRTLDEYRQRFSTLEARREALRSQVSVDERRELEKSLERTKWEQRDIEAEIRHNQEQIERISARLIALQKRLDQSLSRLIKGDVVIEFPEAVQAILTEETTEKT